MSIVSIVYDAKCKHCIHFKYSHLIKKDGTKSKKSLAYCTNNKSNKHKEQLTLKTLACNLIEL